MNAKTVQTNHAYSIGATLVTLALILSVAHYNIEERKLMAGNIEAAVQKGVDPLSVRCSYAKSDDIVCVTLASNSQRINNPVR
jgi:hypothetical protein